MVRFLRNPFWFFLSIISVLRSMRLLSIALLRYECKDYTSVVLGYSEVTLLKKEEDAYLCPSVYCVWLYTALQSRSSTSSNSQVFHTSGGISLSSATFLFLIFLRTESISSCVYCPSLMSICLLIIVMISSYVTYEGFPNKFVVSIVVFVLVGW